MRRKILFAFFTLAFCLFFNSELITAQTDTPKFEFGAHFSTVRFSELDITEPGYGLRLTYNINKHVAVEAEGNFFPRDRQDFLEAYKGQHKTQLLFGIKAGKRDRRFGLFGKVRPGFVNFSHLVRSYECCPGTPPPFEFSQTDFALDLGGVVEFYTSPRTFVRVDVGDTIIHSGSGTRIDVPGTFDPQDAGSRLIISRVTRGTSHNLQLNIGMGFRLFKDAQNENSGSAGISKKSAPKYEIGSQFSSLSINPHSVICFDLCVFGGDRHHTEPGGGVRFTYNVTDNIGLEAEGNLFPRDHRDFSLLGLRGRMAQAQFGAKIGKRFKRFGVFGKARPGFVSFSKVSYLVSSSTLTFFDRQFLIGQFGERKQRFFSTDLGGVFEFYPSRHLMTRVDLGDTIIRYGEIAVPGSVLSNAIQRIRPETRHNFQLSAGVGLRF